MQSKKLRFKNDDFFVKIRGYGTNSDWAKEIKETADRAVEDIRQFCDFDTTLQIICSGVKRANQHSTDIKKRTHTGILRTVRAGYQYDEYWNKKHIELFTGYGKDGNSKYKSYSDRLDFTVRNPIKNPYNDISLTRPTHNKDLGKLMIHGDSENINNALKHVKNIYNELYNKYITNEVKQENLEDVNSSIAEIRWILAHATPWERGSDAISNTFIRSIYKAMGIKTYPLKRGVSLDLEAYCTELKDYKEKFPSYFEHKPKIID